MLPILARGPRSPWRAALLAAALATVGRAGSASAEELLVQAVPVAEQDVRDDGKHPDYRFALTLADGVDPAGLRAHVVRVTAGGHTDALLYPAFSPEVKDAPGLGPALVVRVDFELASAPTTYEVEIALSGKKHDAPLTQSVTVRLVHPAAKLRPPAKLLVSRTWLFAPLAQYPGAISLEEASGRSQLTGLVVADVPPALHDDEAVEGHVAVAVPASLAPGAVARAPLSLEGSFPVGVTRGRLELRAPQLEAPSVVDYEIRVRLPSWVIPLVLLAGTGLGYLIRVRLRKREAHLAQALRARTLREGLERLGARSMPEDTARLLAASKEIADQEDDAEALEAAMKKAEALLASVLEARIAAQRDRLAEAGRALAVLHRGFRLPRAMDVAPVTKAYEEAQRRAVDDDLVGAERARGDAGKRTGELARAARAWRSAIERRLTELEEAKPPARAELPEAALELRGALGKIPGADLDPELEPLLTAVHAANAAALTLAEGVARALAEAADDAAGIVASVTDAEAMRASAEMPEAPGDDDAEEALGHLAKASRALHDAVIGVVAGMMPAAPATRAPIQALLDQRRYAEALSMARTPVPVARRILSPLSGDGDDGTPPAASPLVAPPRRLVAARSFFARREEPGVGGSTNVLVLAAAPGPEDRRTVERQLRETKAVQTILAALIMAGLTWAFYAGDFFGTTRELVALFTLGFTTDVSTDALLAMIDKAKKT